MNQEQRELEIGHAESWCRRLETPFVLVENKSGTSRDEVHKLLSLTPSLSGTAREALIWLRVGLIARAHEIVQDAGTGANAYIHGMVHRLEGDYWNAKYWFRSAGQSTIAKVAEQIQVRESSATFDPSLLVDRLEQFHRSGRSSNKPIESLQITEEIAIRHLLEQEWWALWNLGVH
ncbi:MAG: hypothetical protein MUC83_06880 [Pirellula sp.]|nr:hypothetical protein [Pirellula sp.]